MPSHHLLQEQQQTPPLPAGKSKKSSKSENKAKEKENKERKKKEKKAAKKEKERSASSSNSTAVSSGDKVRKESKKGSRAPAPIPPPQQVPQKRLIEHHEYQNISEETKIDSKSPVMRMFGDTNFLLNHRRKASGQQSQTQQQQKESGLSCGQGVCELLNGVYRFSPHVTSFAELESNKSNVSTPTLIVGGKGSSAATSTNHSHPSTLDPKEYQNFNVSKYLNIDVKTPNLRKNHVHGHHHGHHGHHISSNASSLSSGSSGSNSLNSFDSVEQAIIFQKNKNPDSYLGPFNFRQLLRPTQGPTESLRKRKGINPPSPPPLQRGKS